MDLLVSKVPMFNYVSFCKVLSVHQVNYDIGQFLKNQQSISSQNLNTIVIQEIFKLLMNQISLRKLDFDQSPNIPNFVFFWFK